MSNAATSGQVVSVLTLHPLPGTASALVDHYIEHGILEAADALDSQVLMAADDATTVVITARWRDRTAYRAWQESTLRGEFAVGLSSFLDGPESTSSAVYDVLHAVGVPAAPRTPDGE